MYFSGGWRAQDYTTIYTCSLDSLISACGISSKDRIPDQSVWHKFKSPGEGAVTSCFDCLIHIGRRCSISVYSEKTQSWVKRTSEGCISDRLVCTSSIHAAALPIGELMIVQSGVMAGCGKYEDGGVYRVKLAGKFNDMTWFLYFFGLNCKGRDGLLVKQPSL